MASVAACVSSCVACCSSAVALASSVDACALSSASPAAASCSFWVTTAFVGVVLPLAFVILRLRVGYRGIQLVLDGLHAIAGRHIRFDVDTQLSQQCGDLRPCRFVDGRDGVQHIPHLPGELQHLFGVAQFLLRGVELRPGVGELLFARVQLRAGFVDLLAALGDLQATGGDLRARGCDLGFAVRYLDLRGFQLAAGVGQGLAVLVQGGALVVDLSLAVVELGVGVGFGVVELALRFVDDALAAGLLPVVLHGVFDAVDDFVDDAVVFVVEGVLFGGALDGQADGGVDVAGDAAAGAKNT